jgi:hypothetical protein
MSDQVAATAAHASHESPNGLKHRATGTRPEFPPEDPTLARTPITHSTHHRALGMRLCVETNDARVHASAFDAFGPVAKPGPDEPDAVIRVFVHHVDEEPGFRPRQPLVRAYDGAFWIAASRSSVVSGSARTGIVTGFVSETIADNADFLRSAFLQSAFLQIAQPRSLVAVHSACLARDGRSLMLRGDSGAGKSTLAYAALHRGYSLVAEDVIFLRARSGRTEGQIPPDDIEIHGLPWTMHLLTDAATLFPELALLPAFERPDGRLKLGVRIEDHFPGQTLPDAPLGPLVFVARGNHATPRLTTISRADAIARLEATAIHYERDEDAEHGIWDAFLSNRAYLLETSDDPHANAAALDDVVRDV